MKIILATDPIFVPLGGIGRYTLELATRFQENVGKQEEFLDVRYFNLWNWEDPDRYSDNLDKFITARPSTEQVSFSTLRTVFARSSIAVSIYKILIPWLQLFRLRPFAAEYIFHSPNFMLPKYPGKSVVTIHDLSILKFPEFHPSARVKLLKPLIFKSIKNANHIITDSHSTKRELIDYFDLDEERLSAIPLASTISHSGLGDDDCSELLESLELRPGRFFLFVGTIEPRKNIERLLDAYEGLPQGIKDEYSLVLVGSEGWGSDQIHTRLKELKVVGAVKYIGYVSDIHLEQLYFSALCLVFPSLYEGFGLPIIEAQSLGTAVITSNLSCMPEVAGGAAIEVDPTDVSEIRSAMELLIADTGLRQDLIAKGYANASRYSWDKTVDMTLDVYRKVNAQSV